MCVGRHAAGRTPKHTQHRRLIIGLGRLREEVEIALDEPRHRGATGRRVALRAANHLVVHAERQLRHIRMIACHSYVSTAEGRKRDLNQRIQLRERGGYSVITLTSLATSARTSPPRMDAAIENARLQAVSPFVMTAASEESKR